MPPKYKLKRKHPQAPTEKEYKLITLEEMRTKEQKYFHLLAELKKCATFINAAQLESNRFIAQQSLENKWQDFVSCNPLPKPYIPPDIRLFYSKLKFMEKENVDRNIDWSLMVNERSVLTQDIYRLDMTRRKLNATIRVSIGQEYDTYIRDSLNVLQRIANFLCDDAQVAKCPINILGDIADRKVAVQNEVKDFLDRFTYRIISSENIELKAIDATSAEYSFRGSDFGIHIWCLKDVPLRISHLSEPRLLANFHSIKLLLHIPSTMLQENLVVRALHMHFDFLSENAKSFDKPAQISGQNLNAGIVDLHNCLVNEWFMQMEIQKEVRQSMVKRRLEYEEQVRKYEEQLELNKSRKKGDKKTKKIKMKAKPNNEPLLLANDMFPDVYPEFLEKEQQQYDDFCASAYNPDLFDLTPNEINLRKHCILGGIYQLYYVEKPKQNNFGSFSMTWHRNKATLKFNENVKISPEVRLSQQTLRSTKRLTVFEAERQVVDPDKNCPWFIVTIELPQHICYWGEPRACHFEKTAKIIRRPSSVQVEQTEQNVDAEPNHTATVINPYDSITHCNLYPALYLQDNVSLKENYKAASQRIFRNSFYRESLSSSLLHRRKSGDSPRPSCSFLPISDFPLGDPLTQAQVRHIERHVIPRIISSYKFPKEIQLEDLQLSIKQSNTKGSRVMRRKSKKFPLRPASRHFSCGERQSNPERMFAKYPKVENLHVIANIKERYKEDLPREPKTFAQLLQLVSGIKNIHRLRQYKAADVNHFDRDIITHNNYIKEMLAKKGATSTKTTASISTTKTEQSLQKSLKLDSLFSHNDGTTDGKESSDVKATSLSPIRSEFDTVQECEVETYWHWTTEHILKSEFDRQNHKIVLHTDRLGNFGFAFKRYEHFPFKFWSMEPNKNDPVNEVIFTLETQHVRIILYIAANGVRVHVSEPLNADERQRIMYLVVESPIKDDKELRHLLREHNLNIFAEQDARYYIENGYFSEKHLATELHTYSCMAVHSTQMLFNHSKWNRLAKRRDIILQFKHHQHLKGDLAEALITPGEAFFVDIREACSEDLDTIKLDYNLNWRSVESCSDLHQLIVSLHPTARDVRCKNAQLICRIKGLLGGIRPLSFS